VHFEVESFTESASMRAHDLASGKTTVVRAAAAALDPDRFGTERVSVTSADGSVLPMFLTSRRDLPRSGDVPVLLYGYGGVGISITPVFSVPWAVWLERGGILPVASLRGGGEYGRACYDAGRRASKQNTFDDFCACARWLASSGWSRADRIAINGRSNGGLLVGACLTQRPEMFGAAVADAGVFDMLRFHRFTVGWAWKAEYGDPDDPAQSRWLRRCSPLHNAPGELSADAAHDRRPRRPGGARPLLQVHCRPAGRAAGRRADPAPGGHVSRHGGGKPTAQAIAEAADRLAFIVGALGAAASG
jgi:prolyl oligopeptidase